MMSSFSFFTNLTSARWHLSVVLFIFNEGSLISLFPIQLWFSLVSLLGRTYFAFCFQILVTFQGPTLFSLPSTRWLMPQPSISSFPCPWVPHFLRGSAFPISQSFLDLSMYLPVIIKPNMNKTKLIFTANHMATPHPKHLQLPSEQICLFRGISEKHQNHTQGLPIPLAQTQVTTASYPSCL